MQEQPLEIEISETRLGRLLVASSSAGIRRVDLAEDERLLRVRLARACPGGATAIATRPAAREASREIAAYLDGEVDRIDARVDTRGTSFQEGVWAELRRIPRGETVSYGELASRIGRAGAARAVAQACGSNPVPVVNPCHRVISADGGLGGFALGVTRKRQLLALEGAL